MGRLSQTKGVRATEVRQTWEHIYYEQWGRRERLGTQHQSGLTAADNGEIGVNYVSSKFGEPLLPTSV